MIRKNGSEIITYKIVSNLPFPIWNDYFWGQTLDIYLEKFIPKLKLKQLKYYTNSQILEDVEGNIKHEGDTVSFDFITVK